MRNTLLVLRRWYWVRALAWNTRNLERTTRAIAVMPFGDGAWALARFMHAVDMNNVFVERVEKCQARLAELGVTV